LYFHSVYGVLELNLQQFGSTVLNSSSDSDYVRLL